MASYAYGISQVNLDPQKRTFTVKASKKIAKAGDVIKFTVTASKKGASWGFDRTVRPWKLSPNFGPEDIVGGKTNGLLYFKPGGKSGSASTLEAEVEIAISEDYIADRDKVLRFTVIEDTAAFLRISGGAYADVLVRSNDSEDEIEKVRKRLKGEDRKRLKEGKDGKLVRQDPIERVRVSEIGRRALPGGPRALPGSSPRLLPPAMSPLSGANPAALLPPAAPKPLALPGAPSASNNIVPLTKQQRLAEFQQSTGRGTGRVLRNPSGLGAADDVGGALAKSTSGGALKGGAKMLGRAAGPAQALFAGMEFQDRMAAGQNVVQAGLGTAASTGGGIAGASAGAAAGAAIGSIVPGLGTAIGGVIGGILGSMGGSALAGGAADAITGANGPSAAPEPVPFREGGTIVPGMENMPFNVGGMPGVFNEPGNPEVMTIQPVNQIKDSFDNFKDLFGGKPKEYQGLADAIADAMEDRGIGDPFGLKGGSKRRTFGNMTSDLAEHTMKGLKKIFGGGNNQSGSSDGSGSNGSVPGSGGITSDSPPSVGGGAGRTTANEVYSYLKQKGVSDVHARGIVANVSRESGFKIGAHNPSDPNGGSIGLFQWNAGRAQNMTARVPNWQTNWKGQIDYALQEDYGPSYLNQSYPSAGQAAYDWMNKWERPADYVRAKYTPAVYDAMIAKMNLQSGAVAMGPSAGSGVAPGPQQSGPSGGTQMSPVFQRSGGGATGGGFQQVSYTPSSGASPYGSGATSGAAQPAMQRSGISQASLPPLPPTDTLGGGVQRYGASRDGGSRKHAGVDFDISGNQQFYSRIGGVVDGTPFRYGADGWAIDIYNKEMGVYERIAEAQKVLVKPGQVVQPGQPVVQGESGTGVIHYEIRKKPQGGFENSMDPIAFLNGTGSNPTMLAQGPGSGGGGGGGETVDPDAPTAADAEAFYAFAGGVQGLDMKSAPSMSAPASSGTKSDQLLQTSAQTTIASNAPGPVIVNAPTTSVSSGDGGGGGGDTTAQQPGSTMSDSGLLAFVANQQLMTLGA